MPSDSRLSTTDELNFLRQRVDQLERRNTELSSELSRLHERTQEAEGYRFLFENMEEGFCIIQFIDGPLGPLSDYVHLMANPAYCRHAGLPDVVGRTLREVIPNEAEVWLDYFGTVERTGKPLYFEHELLATERCLGLAAIRIEPAHNHQVAVIFRDVTARKRAESALQHLNAELEQRVELAVAQSQKAEEALRQAQKVEAVGQLTGGIAHDFNNLLGGILGALELARDRLAADPRKATISPLLDSAHGAAQRAAALVHRLLAFSRQQTLQPRPTDVAELVSGMLDLISRSTGPHIAIDYQCKDALWAVRIDPPQLESALLNLCINARDAMPNGGRVRIALCNTSLTLDHASELELVPGDYLCLSVEDTGGGMADDTLSRAVDPFFTTKPLGRGTGLGLSMTYGFVRQSGGQLKITSTLGHGTQVLLYLPRYHAQFAPAALKPLAPAARPSSGAAKRIVVVEDVSAMRLVIAEVLHDLGHEVEMYEDGPMAIAGLENKPPPDLLVSDVGLPGGINGRQLADRLRLRYTGLKVLFVTGYDESTALGQGDFDRDMRVLTKPFTLEALAEQVGQLLDG
ncbi:Blue-light-activated protein [compost metagenome]|uniref:ATP-binding protein n=1 Tax=Pseudomonas TaxID=286 RepID=UPI0004DB1D02|nr:MULTISPECIES: ATP-binding protein [Pseudomonas]KEY88136.1 histidine kinase [Pseudomonas capeferrum]MCH7299370.1 ATP-binding protein [Pseudomonas capeferrum]UDU83577.1 response regulator [Pseudomonas sp. HN2-3]